MSTRVDEKFVLASIWKDLDDNIASVTFYIPEKEPKITNSITKWVMLQVNIEDTFTRSSEWGGEGRFTCYINTRQSLNDYHASRELADDIINRLESSASSLYVSNGSSNVGVIRFGPFVSQPMGLISGIIEHTVTAPFRVYSIS